jgi:glycosyltransferase involved in cell wall biosynthesis
MHVWVPGIREGVGGIQAFSRAYVTALADAFPHLDICVFVKNDSPPPKDPLRKTALRFRSASRFPGRMRTFFMAVMGLVHGVWDRPCCVLTTHLHFLPALCLLRSLCGMPVLSVLHGIEAWNLRVPSRIRALKAADHLMAVSHYTRQVVLDAHGLDPAQISVVPNTFDPARLTIGPKPDYLLMRYGLKADQPVIMTVSRLASTERDKGHRQVLLALQHVRQHHPGVRYLIVGSGDDVPGLQQFVHDHGLQECVIFAGHVPEDEMSDHYKLCDAFVMPSCKEGFGIVFLEAMASGKPVVAGSVDGSQDALDNGRLGLLVNPHDPQKIAEAVCQTLGRLPQNALWHSPELLREAVIQQFGQQRVGPMMAAIVAPWVAALGSQQTQHLRCSENE